jgi:hypothetical protein
MKLWQPWFWLQKMTFPDLCREVGVRQVGQARVVDAADSEVEGAPAYVVHIHFEAEILGPVDSGLPELSW